MREKERESDFHFWNNYKLRKTAAKRTLPFQGKRPSAWAPPGAYVRTRLCTTILVVILISINCYLFLSVRSDRKRSLAIWQNESSTCGCPSSRQRRGAFGEASREHHVNLYVEGKVLASLHLMRFTLESIYYCVFTTWLICLFFHSTVFVAFLTINNVSCIWTMSEFTKKKKNPHKTSLYCTYR